MKYLLILTFLLISCNLLFAQKQTDTNTPLHLLKPDYKIPYGTPEVAGITKVLDRMWSYLDQNTFPELIDKTTQAPVADYSKIDKNTIFKPGDFRLISYE